MATKAGPNNPTNAIIRRQVDAVEFGFYNDDDVRSRSVIEITSNQAFDPLHNPLPGGLYDPRLGPAKETEPPCVTCALKARHCPGHFGHMELSVPVYHPILFNELLALMRIKCLACHRLRAPSRQLAIHRAKFHLLETNRIEECLTLDDKLAIATYHMREGAELGKKAKAADAALALDRVLRDYQPTDSNLPPRDRPITSYEKQLRKKLVAECLATCKSMKQCAHCGAYSPKVRHDSSNKIFQQPLASKLARMNAAENVKLESALVEGNESDDDEPRAEGSDEEMNGSDSESDDEEDDGPKTKDKFMHTGEVLAQLRRTWMTDPYVCNALFGCGNSLDIDGFKVFFMQAVPVPPSRFRPPMHLNGMAVEHSQTQYLAKILSLNEQIRNHFAANNEPRAYATWIDLQTTVNCFMDSSKDPSATPSNLVPPGIKQILERKEGLFRKNMMGKRVDYACRSVISPDPYVGTNEIGLPRYFANVLTYPTPVTDLNVKEMRQLVERGADNYPGARWVEINGRRVDLGKMNQQKREAIAAQLLTHLKRGGMPALVGRQLRDGDYVLMNRQPTLHKPGIMAHRVRVLHNPTQKTIRMHYANCNTYNADFDGDEMNCHFPQSDAARAEAQYIARTDLQYIVPTDGSPLRGLIQDHVVGGVKMTKRDTFLEKWEYQQLLFAALSSLPGLEVIRSDSDIELLPPAVIKPRELWTGKQVVSTLMLHLSKGNDGDDDKMSNFPGLSMERKAKTPESAFGVGHDEHLVLFRDGELLRGVLDKAAFGATDFSLVHSVYEAYGPEKAGLLLNALGRLFTAYIQFYAGHSCRMEDLILTPESDRARRRLVQQAYNVGSRAAKAWADSEGGKVPIDLHSHDNTKKPLKPVEAASASTKIGQLLSGNEGSANFAALDGYMQGKLNPLASSIVKECLPSGLAVPFPYNTFSVMTTTGAKGSIVNQSQVTCALGQQALEGRRVPRLSSGRTLPSFAPYDPNPRADGFVMDRFLTGVRPQEYYFHCMAGREGLVDTAVKTSRSGYLQRCLMKHLEELKIGYDFTVRNAEGGVVQFLYGDDGLDPTKAPYLDGSTRSLEFLARNLDSVKRHTPSLPESSFNAAAAQVVQQQFSTVAARKLKVGGQVKARRLRSGTEWKRGALCRGWFDATIVRASKGHVDIKYKSDGLVVKKVPLEVDLGPRDGARTAALSHVVEVVKAKRMDPLLSSCDDVYRIGQNGSCVSERVASESSQAVPRLQRAARKSASFAKDFDDLICAKYGASLCAPGEAVGSIAAQSIGEPSTQMTLNTFHLAGAGANVTLGIPRLREIIMTASRELKTPTMSVPLRDTVSDRQATKLARDFTKLPLMELISGQSGIAVTERLEKSDAGHWSRTYYVVIKLHRVDRIREAFGLSIHDVAQVVAKSFVPRLSQLMKRELKRAAVDGDGGVAEVSGAESRNYVPEAGDDAQNPPAQMADELDDEDDVDEDDDELGDEDGADAEKIRSRKVSVSYDDDGENAEEGEGAPPQGTRGDEAGPTPATPMALDYKEDALLVNDAQNTISVQPLRVDPASRPLLMVGLAEEAAGDTLVRSRKKISQAFVNDEDGRGRCLQTAGVNFEELWKLAEVDHDRLLSNDIWALRCAYGVEAARSAIGGQIKSVFGAYGIEVDPRHLSLISDYMTFDGGYKAMNRIGMEQTSSSLLQMSFETTVHFLKQAAVARTHEKLSSPSSNIVLGRPIQHGTGSFAMLSRT